MQDIEWNCLDNWFQNQLPSDDTVHEDMRILWDTYTDDPQVMGYIISPKTYAFLEIARVFVKRSPIGFSLIGVDNKCTYCTAIEFPDVEDGSGRYRTLSDMSLHDPGCPWRVANELLREIPQSEDTQGGTLLDKLLGAVLGPGDETLDEAIEAYSYLTTGEQKTYWHTYFRGILAKLK